MDDNIAEENLIAHLANRVSLILWMTKILSATYI